MRILILGTSNALTRDGWVAGLREVLPEAEVENQSVGASSGLHFAQALDTDFSRYDFVLLDSIPNDEQHAQEMFDGEGYSSEPLVARIMFEICSTIAAKAKVVFVGFFQEEYLAAPSSVYARTLRIAQAIGAQFIDLRSLILEFGAAIIGEGEDLFLDAAHPQRAISRTIGRALGRALWDGAYPDRSTTSRPASFRSNFFIWDAEKEAAPSSLTSYSNSLFDERYLDLGEGEALNFAEHGLCLGFGINAYRTSAVVTMHGADRDLAMRCYFQYRENGIQRRFLAIPHGIHLKRLTVCRAPEVRSIAAHASWPTPFDEAVTQLSLSKIVFWSGDPNADWPTASSDGAEALALQHAVRAHCRQEPSPLEGTTLTLRAVRDSLCKANDVKRIHTFHGTVLAYDLRLDECRHVPLVAVDNAHTLFDVKVRLEGTSVVLNAEIGLFELPLTVRRDGVIGFEVPPGYMGPALRLKTKYERGIFALTCRGLYLSAEPGGKIVTDRPHHMDWECFWVGLRSD